MPTPAIINDLKERGLSAAASPRAQLSRSAGAATRRCCTTRKPSGSSARRPCGPADGSNGAINWIPEHIKHGPLRRVAGEQHRLGDLARPLLGHAAAGVGVRTGTPTESRSIAELRELAGRVRCRGFGAAQAVHRRVHLAGAKCGGDDAARERRDRRLVRLGLDAVRAVALSVRERRSSSEALPGGLHLPRPWTRRAAGSTRCSRSPRCCSRAALFLELLCLGHILDNEGHKMSKPKGNVVDPACSTSTAPTPCAGISSRAARGSRAASPPSWWPRRAQVHAHAVEHVLLLRALRQHRRLRSGRRTSGDGRSPSTAGSRDLHMLIENVTDELERYDAMAPAAP